jgi:hypothetical protein
VGARTNLTTLVRIAPAVDDALSRKRFQAAFLFF